VGLLSGKSLVVGVPLISCAANVAGFAAPFLIGYVRDATRTCASVFSGREVLVASACAEHRKAAWRSELQGQPCMQCSLTPSRAIKPLECV
jgi:hypothetical protein